ncbi:MAG TPA: carboxylating nicotinate-nucleotide diphosphorylase [Thermoleophilaceae bacterium]
MDDLIERALAEDVGAGDVTAASVVPADARADATIEQREPGVIAGLEPAARVFAKLDPDLTFEPLVPEGEWREPGEIVRIEGSARPILTGERVALNFLGRLSGVATLAARYVAAVEGTGAKILDTRKTTPGLRRLEKEAVRLGGATNHRSGLHDAILIKENHSATAGGVGEATRRALAGAPDGIPVEVECATLAEVEEALAAGADRILLDNMTPAELRRAVEVVDGRALLEASGGVTLETVREIAETGVDFVSVGALTHSAPALDLSLMFRPR